MDQRNDKHEPSLAPGLHMDDNLAENASEEEVKRGQSTEVTRLYLDRTPDE